MFKVAVQEADFDVSTLQSELQGDAAKEGACVTFTGYVRGQNQQRDVHCMLLEHYPQMTEKSIHKIVTEAADRWPLLAASVVHRIGKLYPADQIVWVGTCSAHRKAAFAACEFIMDYLKNDAPFWKKELGPQGDQWVEAHEKDQARARRWRIDTE